MGTCESKLEIGPLKIFKKNKRSSFLLDEFYENELIKIITDMNKKETLIYKASRDGL